MSKVEYARYLMRLIVIVLQLVLLEYRCHMFLSAISHRLHPQGTGFVNVHDKGMEVH
jgi:hypothetical protein